MHVVFCSVASQLPLASIACQIRDHLPIDMIFSDLVGVGQFKAVVRDGYGKFRSDGNPRKNNSPFLLFLLAEIFIYFFTFLFVFPQFIFGMITGTSLW